MYLPRRRWPPPAALPPPLRREPQRRRRRQEHDALQKVRRLGALRLGGQSGHCRREGSCRINHGLCSHVKKPYIAAPTRATRLLLLIGRTRRPWRRRRRTPMGTGSLFICGRWSRAHALAATGGGPPRVGDGAMGPSMDLDALTRPEAWGVLAVSLGIALDGRSTGASVQNAAGGQAVERVFFGAFEARPGSHFTGCVVRPPAAACGGVVVAAEAAWLILLLRDAGVRLRGGHRRRWVAGGVGGVLAMLNGRYLIGAAVEQECAGRRRSIVTAIASVRRRCTRCGRSVWRPTPSRPHEVDFDGTWVARTARQAAPALNCLPRSGWRPRRFNKRRCLLYCRTSPRTS